MDLVFVGDRCDDHSPSSGYDQVCSLFPAAGWLSGRALVDGTLRWLREPSAGHSHGPRVYHVIYGDCSGKALPALLRQRFPRAALIASAHQPAARLRDDDSACAALRGSDGIVAVSSVQAGELRELGFAAPIHSIPHGVWTDVFRPPSAQQSMGSRREVLIVGSFLRDWDGARQVIEGLAGAGIRCTALGAGARKNWSADRATVEVPPRVSESELAAKYHQSAVVFLPFLQATASNSLLEAMAAGCPVVCPRLPSLVEDYLPDDSDCFEPGRYDVALSRLLHYVRDPAAREAKSRTLIARAARFDWAGLRESYAAAYEDVARSRAAADQRERSTA
jgi:glycosyltransferase involved in cell wall biosynthesis